MLVWSEMAAAYQYTDYAVEEFTKEWMEIVRQNYNHPCIITWTPFNESWGVSKIETRQVEQHFTEAIYYLTKSFDTMRPVLVNDGWEHNLHLPTATNIRDSRSSSANTVELPLTTMIPDGAMAIK